MLASTRKDTAKSVKTLLVLLQSMRNQQVTITLRNDTIVRGTILKVDANMNIELKDATVESDLFYSTTPVAAVDSDQQSDSKNNDGLIEEQEFKVNSDIQGGTRANFAPNNSNNDTTEEMTTKIDQDNDNDGRLDGSEEEEDDDDDDEGEEEQQTNRLHDYFLVKGSRVRHIDVPTDYDLLASGRSEIERIRNRCKQWTKRDIVRKASL